MIYLSHVDTKRQDMIVQAKFLEQSHKDVGITHPLVILKTDERKKYKKYSVTDVNYAMYNRYISVMEYIKNHSLQKETICVLDCDMFFFKEYIPIEVTNNEVVSQEWYGAERWVNEWKWFLDSDFDHYQKDKKFDNTVPNKLYTPYYMKGETLYNLYKTALNVDNILRKKHKWWMTELLAVNYASWYLNLKITYDTIAAVRWFLFENNPKGKHLENYSLIHYCNDIEGIKPSNIKKYHMHDGIHMIKSIKNFLSTDKPKIEWDKKTLDFFIKMYKGIDNEN
jgi:hypothetical protein